MQRLADLERKKTSLSGLLDVVSAMRVLAAAREKEAQEARRGVARHTEIVRAALAAAFRLVTAEPEQPDAPPKGPLLLVAFTSEHGFVGVFNERVLERAAEELTSPSDRLLVVGARGASLAGERKLAVASSAPMATHAGGLLEVARRTADEVYARVAQEGFGRVAVVHGASVSGASFEVEVRHILPIAVPRVDIRGSGPEAGASALEAAGFFAEGRPLVNLDPARLVEKLSDELVFAELMRAAVTSFAGENAARLAAMEAAHENIEQKLVALGIEVRQRRQDEITNELLDVVTGAAAVRPR